MSNTINKLPRNWTDEQLLKWAIDEVVAGGKTTDEEVAKEICKRLEIEFTDVEAAKEALTTQSVNEDSEVDVVDITDEVLNMRPEQSEEPVQEEVTQIKVTEDKPAPVVKAPLAKLTGSAVLEGIKDNLDNYLVTMKPGVAHAGNIGMITQTGLYRTIRTIMRLEQKEFHLAFSSLLEVVNAHRKEHFNERYAYRYFDTLKLSNKDRTIFENLMNLLMTTCDPTMRSKALNQVDLVKTTEGLDEAEAQKVKGFYHDL